MVKKALTASDAPNVDSLRPVSKSQKSFHTLVTRIRERRATLAAWEAYRVEFNRKYNGELVPRRQKLDEVRSRLIHRLDQSHDMRELTKAERGIVAELITHFADQVLMWVDDPVVAEIHGRYSASARADEASIPADQKTALHQMPVVDPTEAADASSPEETMRRIQEQLDQQERSEDQQRQAREDAQAGRRKAQGQKATRKRAQAEEAEAHVSLREVYRKLVSALHPDREADPVERGRKAALMQRVNRAYAGRSLLELLEIQLELEHIDQAAIDSVSAERLKRWNAVLKEQLRELDKELVEVDSEFQMRCGLKPAGTTSPKIIKRALNEYLADVNRFIQLFERDLRVFDDVERLKPWLRAMKGHLQSVD
ncbi:hypothetical protein [Luteibacter aegosomatissinici]|uniref:hypothetical protein n=1 Tax=Luteibacter aegosomatissinici TaxID=2911539 RepID=UPI001FF86D6F|nr:hypothetical protein [Luteibacter aegosomatissinici]UPG94752.1 hypothetical protein L2Y97_01205 [Luteibacter aegosomatissinici]